MQWCKDISRDDRPKRNIKLETKYENPRYQSRHLSRESTGEKVDQVLSHRLIRSAPSTDFGKGSAAKWVEFSEKFQTVFDPPPSISENYITIIFMIEMVAYMQGGMMAR